MSDSVRLPDGSHLKRGDVVFWEIKDERSVVRVDNVRLTHGGFTLMDYTVLFPKILVGCLMRQDDFPNLKNIKPLFNLSDHDLDNFLELMRFMAMYEKIKIAFGGEDPVSEAFDEAVKGAGLKSIKVGVAKVGGRKSV